MASSSWKIASSTTIEGSITGDGDLVVHGRVDGAVDISGALRIEDGGIVSAEVRCADLHLAGVLTGSVDVSGGAALAESARFVGTLTANVVAVERGAAVRGRLTTTGEGGAGLTDRGDNQTSGPILPKPELEPGADNVPSPLRPSPPGELGGHAPSDADELPQPSAGEPPDEDSEDDQDVVKADAEESIDESDLVKGDKTEIASERDATDDDDADENDDDDGTDENDGDGDDDADDDESRE